MKGKSGDRISHFKLQLSKPMACDYDKIIASLHEEKETVKDIVYEKVNTSDRLALRKIKSGGVVRRNQNNDSVIYGQARQEAIAYRNLDHEPRELIDGEMRGRKLNGRNGLFQTSINDLDDNACHGRTQIDFSQGYRRIGTEDFGLDLETPVKCARDLERMDNAEIEGYFDGFRTQFTVYGMDNFSDNLLNLVIERGEANASVQGPDEFEVSRGGWKAPPENRITIHFLEEYRDHIISEMRTLNLEVNPNMMLEIELPLIDWLDAVKEDLIQIHGMVDGNGQSLTRFQGEMLKDPESDMRGRKYSEYGNIRCYFNDEPIRGHFRQSGTDGSGSPTYNFVRVYPTINDIGGEGGLVQIPNHAYREDTIEVDGIQYDMVTLAPHIHPASFQHFQFEKPKKPMGGANHGVNYNVEVIDKAYIPNNKHNDMFQLVARHEFRFKAKYPQLSGCIAYRHGRRPGYVLPVVRRNKIVTETSFAGPEKYRQHDIVDSMTLENCDACEDGNVPRLDGQCVDPSDLADSSFRLVPAGTSTVIFDDAEGNKVVRIGIRREGELAQESSVGVAVIAGTASPGTHYTVVSGGASHTWGVNDDSVKYIELLITDGSGDADVDIEFTIVLSALAALGDASIVNGAGEATIKIKDLSD